MIAGPIVITEARAYMGRLLSICPPLPIAALEMHGSIAWRETRHQGVK